ncbi:Prkg2, partial [Symbiodinium sp. CCMP2456]
VEPDILRSASEADVVAELEPRDSFGELSLIYNTFREATFKAVEDSEVYVISRKHFKAHFNRRGPRFKDYCALLDEVPALWPLLRAERWELACNALGLFSFRPGERIIHQGLQRKSALWYIVFSGSCVVSASHTGPDGQETTEVISTLRRPGHFGERSLLRGGEHAIPEVSVDAGKEGLVCLAFEGQAIRVLLEELSIQGAFGDGAEALLPNVNSLSSTEYELAKLGRMRRQRVQTEEIDMMSLNKVCHLGRGGFADVYLMEDNVSQKRYAMKCISKGHVEKFEAVRQVCWEREMLMTVDSPFVIRLVRTHKDAEFLYILLEAALGGTLYKLMRQKPEVFCDDEPRGSSSAFFVGCIIAALEHLHDRRIVYRDLKPENVLLDEHGYAKLCDMGFARFVISKTNTLAGTPEYMAPEVIDFPHAHDVTCDWWSLGVLTFELNAGQPPWEDEGVADLFGKLLAIRRSQEKGDPRYPFSCPLPVRNFISKLLTKLPHRLGARKGARELREHFFFKKLSFDFQALKAQTLPPPLARPFQQREYAMCGMEDLSGELLKNSELFKPVQGACMWDADF